MSGAQVIIRTDKGDNEVVSNASKLPIKHRSVLVMINGKMTEGQMAKQMAAFNVAEILKDLEAQGFIGRAAAPPQPEPKAAPAPVVGKAGGLLESIVQSVKEASEGYEKK